MVESLTRDRGAAGSKPHQRHCVVSFSKNINSSFVLVQPRKTRPYITERLLMGRKESNQTKQNHLDKYSFQNCNLGLQAPCFVACDSVLEVCVANRLNSDKTAPHGAVLSGFKPFAWK